jgi:hypothetical protein
MGEPLKASKRESRSKTSLPIGDEKGPWQTTRLRGGRWTAGNRPEPTRAHGRGWIPPNPLRSPPCRPPARPVPPREHKAAPARPHPYVDAYSQARFVCVCGGGVSVAESELAPPGPIPNPVVTQFSAGEYCGGDPVGGEAAAGTPPLYTHQHTPSTTHQTPRGGAAAARWAHNPKVAGSNPAPATTWKTSVFNREHGCFHFKGRQLIRLTVGLTIRRMTQICVESNSSPR